MIARQTTSSTPLLLKSLTNFANDGTWPFSQTPVKAPGSAKRTTFLPAKSWWRDVPVKPARGACGALGGCRRGRRDSVVSGRKKLRRRRRRTAGRRVRAVRLGRVPRARRLQITRRQLQQIETRGDAAARRGAACGSRASECGAEHGCCDAVASGSEEKLGFKRHTSSKSTLMYR